MKAYIDQSINSYSSLKVLVLTGGECFTLGKDLEKIISYGTQKNLSVRAVTNGYWAKTYKKAFERLIPLVNAGLKEINFSTGDDHLEWVPYDSIINAVAASMDLGLDVIINVEKSSVSGFNSQTLLDDDRLQNYLYPNKTIQPLRIINGYWIPFIKETDEKRESSTDTTKVIHTQNGCKTLFNTISITPHHQLLACCGLTCEYSKYLKLGSLKSHSIKFLYENQFDDFLKIWLYTEGPKQILSFLSAKRGECGSYENTFHICQSCASILTSPDNIKLLQEHYHDVLPNVLLKYAIDKQL
jgi:hypothetical protein